MTKDAYFDLCFQLESEPIDEEIPVDLEDLPSEVVEAWTVYSYLPDRIDSFAGTYLGKDISSISQLLELFSVESKELVFRIVMYFDRVETEAINSKLKNRPKK